MSAEASGDAARDSPKWRGETQLSQYPSEAILDFVKSTSHDYPRNSNRKVTKILQRLDRCHHLFIYLQEQTRQHAVTIVAMEERLLRLTRQNRQLEQEAMHAKQTTG